MLNNHIREYSNNSFIEERSELQMLLGGSSSDRIQYRATKCMRTYIIMFAYVYGNMHAQKGRERQRDRERKRERLLEDYKYGALDFLSLWSDKVRLITFINIGSSYNAWI